MAGCPDLCPERQYCFFLASECIQTCVGAQGDDRCPNAIAGLSKAPSKPALGKLDALAGTRDEYRLLKQEIYLHCPINYGQTKLSNTAIEKALSVGATTRNWKTVTTLSEMAAG
jgi:uncharacterized protein (DUF1697 family)